MLEQAGDVKGRSCAVTGTTHGSLIADLKFFGVAQIRYLRDRKEINATLAEEKNHKFATLKVPPHQCLS